MEESAEAAKKELGVEGEGEEGEMNKPGDTPTTKQEETMAGAEIQEAPTNKSM